MNELFKAAADLWLNQIENGRQDNGDAMQSMMSQMLKNKISVTAIHISKFKEHLCNILEEEFKGRDMVILAVDYDPNPLLEKCCKESGIDPYVLPIKSVMWVYKDVIKYKFGYSAQIEEHRIK